MKKEPSARRKTWFSWGELIVLTIVFLVLGSIISTMYVRASPRILVIHGTENCERIMKAMKAYAADHAGKYPDAYMERPRSSNGVFRELFKDGYVGNEEIFGCPLSPYGPKLEYESTSEFSKILPERDPSEMFLEPGENHWAMTAGVRSTMSGSIPLVFENPVSASWPPVWNADAVETKFRGRTWSTGIILGMNDGSVSMQPLESRTGPAVSLQKAREGSNAGKNLFEAAIDAKDFPVGKVLDVDLTLEKLQGGAFRATGRD